MRTPARSLTVAVIIATVLAGCTRTRPQPFAHSDGLPRSVQQNGWTITPNEHYGFEDSTALFSKLYVTEPAYTGRRCMKLRSGLEYSADLKRLAGNVADSLTSISTGFWYWSEAADPRIGAVVRIKRGDSTEVLWDGKEVSADEHRVGTWSRFNAEFKMKDARVLPTDTVILFLWNHNKELVFIDDMDVVFRSGRKLGVDPQDSSAFLRSLHPEGK